MMLPEEYGGAGVVADGLRRGFRSSLGHGPVPGPLFTSGILSAQMIFEACTDEQRKALLPALCNGEVDRRTGDHRQSRPTGDRKRLKPA